MKCSQVATRSSSVYPLKSIKEEEKVRKGDRKTERIKDKDKDKRIERKSEGESYRALH